MTTSASRCRAAWPCRACLAAITGAGASAQITKCRAEPNGIADQAPSSLTNFTLSVVVARADVPAGFGAMEASRLPPEPPTLVQPC